MYIHVYIYIYHLYTYIYIERERHGERERDRERQTERERESGRAQSWTGMSHWSLYIVEPQVRRALRFQPWGKEPKIRHPPYAAHEHHYEYVKAREIKVLIIENVPEFSEAVVRVNLGLAYSTTCVRLDPRPLGGSTRSMAK